MDNAGKEIVPVGKGDAVTHDAEVVPEVLLAPHVLPEPLVGPVGELEDLMEEEGEHVEEEEVEGEILHPMPVVVFDMVAVVLHRIEDLILDHPPCSPDADHLLDTLVVYGQVGDPTVVVPYLLSLFEPVLEVVDERGVFRAVQGNGACPLVDVGPAFPVFVLHVHDLVLVAAAH